MSTIKSSDEHLTLNADGSSKDIKFQANGVEKASISSAGVLSSAGGSTHADNVKAKFGTGNDLEIYHDGNHSRISDVGTGSLYIKAANNLQVTAANGDTMGEFTQDGAVSLYHNGSKKIETTANGVSVTGAIAGATNLGKVLQVKHYESSGAVTFPQDTSITTTMVSGAITPSATTSKILVLQFMSFGLNGGNYPACSAKLFRDSTEIWQKVHLGYMDSNSFDRRFDFSRANYDSPNTTSEITYYLKGGNGTGSGFSGTYGGAGNKTSPGTLTLIEIGA